MKCSVKLLFLLAFSALSMACATQQTRRDSAKVIGAQTARLQRELSTFADARTRVNATRQLTMQELLRSALDAEISNARKEHIWKIEDDKKRPAIYHELLAEAEATRDRLRAADEEIAAGETLIAGARSRVDTRTTQLTSTTKTLARLAEREKLADEIKFFVSFFQEVDATMKEVRSAVEKAANGADLTASTLSKNSKPGDGK